MAAPAIGSIMIVAWLLVAGLLPADWAIERAICAIVALVCIGALASERFSIWGPADNAEQ